ncbi:MAG: hypothetical protein EOO36_18040 [Cytophagaceae bacterium]|nr:MAG: hypothetical protein EOO36_18040 [Cytophagaceae bacterium]
MPLRARPPGGHLRGLMQLHRLGFSAKLPTPVPDEAPAARRAEPLRPLLCTPEAGHWVAAAGRAAP